MNLNEFTIDDTFDINWLKISEDSRILKKIANNAILHKIIKEQITYSNDKKLLKIFVTYF